MAGPALRALGPGNSWLVGVAFCAVCGIRVGSLVKPSGPERESGVKIWLAWLLCIRVQGERLVPTMGYTPTATQRQAKEAAAEPARAAAEEQGRRPSRGQTVRGPSLTSMRMPLRSVESTFAASGPPPPPRTAAMPLPRRCHCRRKGERQHSHEVDTPVVRVSHPNVSRARTRDTEPRPEPDLGLVPSGAEQA